MIYATQLILLALVCDPAYLRLFTPTRPTLGRYEVCVLEDSKPEGYKYADPERVEPLDAFGTAGAYNRATLVQLFGGRRVTVVRGWRESPGRFESVTLLSPYPNPVLTHLEPGTLMIRWIIDRP